MWRTSVPPWRSSPLLSRPLKQKGPHRCGPPARGSFNSGAFLATRGACAGGLRLRFAHVLTLLGLAVERVFLAVVDLRVGVDPHLARAAGRSGLPARCRGS